jgi:pilus assembly protein Flp/PilA
MNKLMRFVKDESGVTAIEYGLIAAAIGLMLVVAMPIISGQLQGVFTAIGNGLSGAGAGGGEEAGG